MGIPRACELCQRPHSQEVSEYGFESMYCLCHTMLPFVEISSLLLPLRLSLFLPLLLPLRPLPLLHSSSFFFFGVCIYLSPRHSKLSEVMKPFVRPILEAIKIVSLDMKDSLYNSSLQGPHCALSIYGKPGLFMQMFKNIVLFIFSKEWHKLLFET